MTLEYLGLHKAHPRQVLLTTHTTYTIQKIGRHLCGRSFIVQKEERKEEGKKERKRERSKHSLMNQATNDK